MSTKEKLLFLRSIHVKVFLISYNRSVIIGVPSIIGVVCIPLFEFLQFAEQTTVHLVLLEIHESDKKGETQMTGRYFVFPPPIKGSRYTSIVSFVLFVPTENKECITNRVLTLKKMYPNLRTSSNFHNFKSNTWKSFH